MKNLLFVSLTLILTCQARANHWNFECPVGGGRTANVLINNKKAKLVTPFARGIFIFNNKSEDAKVYKGTTNEGQAMLLAPNTDFQLSKIPMGEKAEFTYEVAGPHEALIMRCETVPTFKKDPDLD